ncbi:DUF6223 family protein [Streptosporangium pseudovulgare]|uniref:DUF6223 family protein n=1 Tax=Streptosporangium pseudovulgare TaxID=35765 RepID=UPI001E552040|nr:DUF6223 family protein [Streptosporangium pseudovulgare]
MIIVRPEPGDVIRCVAGYLREAAATDGGLGTGNGVFEGPWSWCLGLIGAVLGGLALTRSRRTQPERLTAAHTSARSRPHDLRPRVS